MCTVLACCEPPPSQALPSNLKSTARPALHGLLGQHGQILISSCLAAPAGSVRPPRRWAKGSPTGTGKPPRMALLREIPNHSQPAMSRDARLMAGRGSSVPGHRWWAGTLLVTGSRGWGVRLSPARGVGGQWRLVWWLRSPWWCLPPWWWLLWCLPPWWLWRPPQDSSSMKRPRSLRRVRVP